ncbi:MAG: rhomboid family intramembrane serine protease [Anaerolineae bacterium]
MIPLRDTVRARDVPVMNYGLITANVLVFLMMASWPEREIVAFTRTYGLIPARLLEHPGLEQYLTVLSSMFLHGGWFHLLSNMWVLWIFGDNVEDRLGHLRYLLFYLLCGAAAAAAHLFVNPTSSIPTVGASGAISGVMAAYVLLFPRARVLTFVPLFLLPWTVEVPALIFIGMWFVSQLFNGLFSLAAVATYGGVAYWAHIGGFVAGLLLVNILKKRYYRRFYADEYWPW